MKSMEELIHDELRALQDALDVRVLLAVESGSRAWGFASPDSDYDVRFVYVHPLDWYLGLEPKRDTIEWRLDEVYDVVGWDLTKFLQLARKSNPSVMEWLASPIVYAKAEDAGPWMRAAAACFDPNRSCRHYLSMAKNNYASFLRDRDTVSAKKCLYVTRALLSARWACEYLEQPPMLFSALVGEKAVDPVRSTLDRLLEVKAAADESKEVALDAALGNWMEEQMCDLEQMVASLDARDLPAWDGLNVVFRDVVLSAEQGFGNHVLLHE